MANPRYSVDAVVAERLTGATVATPTVVFVVPRGEQVSVGEVFCSDHAQDVKVRWESPDTLVVSAATARVFREEAVREVRQPDARVSKIEVVYGIRYRETD